MRVFCHVCEEVVNTQYGSPAVFSDPAPASADPSTLDAASLCDFRDLLQRLKDIGHDQLGMWSSPSRLNAKDAFWLVPFATATVIAFRIDSATSQALGFNPQRVALSNNISDLGSSYATVGFGAALWSIGTLTHHDHVLETGRLGLEAIANAYLIDEAIKFATNRQRPYVNTAEEANSGRPARRGWPVIQGTTI